MTFRSVFRKITDLLVAPFVANESLGASKRKWNRFGRHNPRYFVFTKRGPSITEEEFRAEGQREYQKYLSEDAFLQSKLARHSRALEIGCGAGRITEFIAKDFSEVWGADISESMLAEAVRRLPTAKNIRWVATDGATLPAPDDFFDLAFSFIVFQHMPSETVIRCNFEEISRTLRPGGIAKIQLRGTPITRFSKFYGPSFTQASVENLLRDLPLRIIKSEGEGEKYFWLWFEKMETPIRPLP